MQQIQDSDRTTEAIDGANARSLSETDHIAPAGDITPLVDLKGDRLYPTQQIEFKMCNSAIRMAPKSWESAGDVEESRTVELVLFDSKYQDPHWKKSSHLNTITITFEPGADFEEATFIDEYCQSDQSAKGKSLFAIKDQGDLSIEVLRPARLRALLNRAQELGASVSASFGESIGEIVDDYRAKVDASTYVKSEKKRADQEKLERARRWEKRPIITVTRIGSNEAITEDFEYTQTEFENGTYLRRFEELWATAQHANELLLVDVHRQNAELLQVLQSEFSLSDQSIRNALQYDQNPYFQSSSDSVFVTHHVIDNTTVGGRIFDEVHFVLGQKALVVLHQNTIAPLVRWAEKNGAQQLTGARSIEIPYYKMGGEIEEDNHRAISKRWDSLKRDNDSGQITPAAIKRIASIESEMNSATRLYLEQAKLPPILAEFFGNSARDRIWSRDNWVEQINSTLPILDKIQERIQHFRETLANKTEKNHQQALAKAARRRYWKTLTGVLMGPLAVAESWFGFFPEVTAGIPTTWRIGFIAGSTLLLGLGAWKLGFLERPKVEEIE